MWLFSRKKKVIEYTEEEQKKLDKTKEYFGTMPYPSQNIVKILKKQRDLSNQTS